VKHLLSSGDVGRDFFKEIYQLSTRIRKLLRKGHRRFPVLRGRCVVNLFFEPSTRTRSSFELAGKFLSADVVNITASASSVVKGEGLIDTLRNIDSMRPDVVVLRHPCEGAPHILRNFLRASIVNAGDGRHEHPTQALLDAVTLLEHFGSFSGKRITLVGDILNSRVARSDALLFRRLGAEVFVFGPPTMLPADARSFGVKPLNSFEEVAQVSDAVVMLRIQLERQDARRVFPSFKEYSVFYGMNAQRLSMLKPNAVVLHPGPVNRGVELSGEVVDSERSLIFHQVETGVAVRMVVLTALCGALSDLKACVEKAE